MTEVPPREEPDVDDLRRRLMALGYLDAGVDRFVLAPVRESRTGWRNAVRASARIGLLAGILLGPAAAVGVATRVPELVTGARDAVVLALYLGVSFGFAAALAALVVALTAGAFARRWPEHVAARAGSVARAVGAIVAVLCLIYLTLWWNAAGEIDSPPSLLWTIGALVVAVAISALLFRAVSASTLAVLAQTRADVALVPRTKASRRLTIITGGLALVGSLLLLWSVSPVGQASTAAAAASPLVVVPTGWRVVVLAIDGFDREVARRALDPASRLLQVVTGASAELTLPDDRDPARIWTSVATGLPPGDHGISGLEERRVAGLDGSLPGSTSGVTGTLGAALDLIRLTRPTISGGIGRRERTFWEIAAAAGLRSAVVNWWATWPAGEDEGIVVTDRATLRLERGGDLDAEIAPSTMYPAFQATWPETRALIERMAEAHSQDLPDATRATSRRAVEVDAAARVMALHSDLRESDLLSVYFPGLDIVSTTLLEEQSSEGRGLATLVEQVDTVERYYRTLDELVTPLLDPADDRLIIVVGLPGRLKTSTPAVLAVSGPHVRAGASSVAQLQDVVPTVLYALGLPMSDELEGQPLTMLFEPTFVERHAVRHVPTFGRRAAVRTRQDQRLDAEARERLRSLGYVR